MILDSIVPAPPDPILGLTEAFKKDPSPRKVNLGVGVYVDDEGRTPVLKSVKQAEKVLWETQTTKSYMPISGSPEYGVLVQSLLFGEAHPILRAGRLQTAHTPGGTGGLRVGAEFLRKVSPGSRVWISSPTWPNHKGIFAAAGFRMEEYPYYDAAGRGIALDAMCDALEKASPNDVVLLHVCCHNPTGVDLSADQWRRVAGLLKSRGVIPFLDFAYQGFGDGVEADRTGLLAVLETGLDLLVASSFSKNFGLYQDRVGALTLVAGTPAAADAAFSHVKTVIRVIYSNPAAHGGAIVTTILKDKGLRALWEEELLGMRKRIADVRRSLVEHLRERNAPMDFSFINQQKGMFSFSGLSDAQVAFLRERKSVYMVAGGRMNVAGVTSANLDYVCDSVAEAITSCA